MGATEEAKQKVVKVKFVDPKNPDNIEAIGDAEDPVNVSTSGVEEDHNIENDREGAEETSLNKDMKDCIPSEAKEMLKSLASKWDNVIDVNALQVIPLKGAMTNEVFQIEWQTPTGESSRKVLLRIYSVGSGIFFDRNDEVTVFELLSKSGQGPGLLGRFANGRIEEFINARTLSASDMRDPSISALIAAKLKEFHDVDMSGPKNVNIWDRLRNWLSEAKQLCSPHEAEAFHLDKMDNEISTLESELSTTDQPIGFCHNDLQYGNIMLDEQSNSVILIDYEYASYNPVAYDIANHFNEMAANYDTDTPHVLDFNKYPDLEERGRFVRAYLSSSGKEPNDNEVEQLLDEVEKYALANHLLWGIWGLISKHVNKIDFDYKEYSKQRFHEYWSRKSSLLSSHDSSHDNVEQEPTSTSKKRPTKSNRISKNLKKFFGLGVFRSKN